MRKFLFTTIVLICLVFALGLFKEHNVTAKVKVAPMRLSYKSGHATYYDLCNGSNGACGDCDDDEMHAAWPHLPATGCYRYCSYVGPLSCGSDVMVSDHCPYKYRVEVEIHDCCTCNGTGGCNGGSRCSGSYWNGGDVIIDLTTEAFISLHGNLSDGRIPVGVYY